MATGTSALADRLHLICGGAGTATGSTERSVSHADAGGNSATDTVRIPYSTPYTDQVDVDIDGETGKIRVPRNIVSGIHGGTDGVFEMRKIKFSDREITATVSFNPFEGAKVRIDRMTGHISINASDGSFAGECTKFDPATAERRF